ncbi:MAG: efflux RND transporter periplasmic adaptor subunit [Firmicutes bacterium]|nr:efflux RND transporter periplasmic adaptor subunit [Bacillota bacterium]
MGEENNLSYIDSEKTETAADAANNGNKPEKERRALKKAVTAAVIIIAAGVLGFGGIRVYNWWQERKARQTTMADVMMMATESVRTGGIAQTVSASGVVYLQDEQSVYATTTAKVSSVNVEVGDKVTAGEEIVTYDTDDTRTSLRKQISQTEINLDNLNLTLQSMTAPPSVDTVRQLQNAVDSAETSLYNANQTYSGTQTKISDQQAVIKNAEDGVAKAEDGVLKAEDGVAKAQTVLEKAKQTLSDNAELLAVGAISQNDYNKAEDSVTSAEDAVTSARDAVTSARDAVTSANNTLTSAKNGLRDLNTQLESNQVGINTAQKNLNNAKQNLADSSVVLKNETDKINYEKQQNQIKLTQLDLDDLKRQLADTVDGDVSPIDGIVTAVGVSRGSSVGTSSVLVKVADFNKLIVKSNISEYDIPKLALGQSVTMTSDGLPGKTYTGKISKIGDSAAGGSASSEATVPVEVSIGQIDGVVKPGFSLDMTITTADNPAALMISLGAVKNDAETGESYVFKVENGVLRRTAVTLGIVSDMDVEVKSGLADGDVIISSPADTMTDGMPYTTDPSAFAGLRNNNGGGQNSGGGLFRIGGGGGGAVRAYQNNGGGGQIRDFTAP